MQENWKRSTGYPPTSCNGRNIKANDIVERAARVVGAAD